MTALSTILEHAPVRLEPLADEHIEPLRAACRLDQEIWGIYPVNLGGDGFDDALAMFRSSPEWVNFAVIDARSGELAGLTNYIRPTQYGVVEIGGTYIVPEVRGGAFNRAMKKLMIEHAFECGFHKIEFRVDTRNKRSQAAVLKLGAQQEGVMRQNMVTWTGYRRDTAVFGLLKDEWHG
ncbi:GCN5 family acetyltransferase [Erythrobacter longus]|uniref:GCN5 family acetyltransferase n=1 Tax=Erythrobacter longus TaxID=1044 RepID=A0A074M8A1_ERYLO|nr:GNAT family protein [Erythrobacter longus]KEO88995.1 GCN5 family acetyltransferase [Erythrobacter longus]